LSAAPIVVVATRSFPGSSRSLLPPGGLGTRYCVPAIVDKLHHPFHALGKEVQIILEDDHLVAFKLLTVFLFLALDNCQKEIPVPVFLDVEKVCTSIVVAPHASRKQLAPNSHVLTPVHLSRATLSDDTMRAGRNV
jgi:hypothetical protein